MKKVLLTFALVGFLAGSSFASTDPVEKKAKRKAIKTSPVNLSYESAKKVKLTVLDDEKGSIDLTVTDQSTGKKIADHLMSYHGSFALPIDMTAEKDGQYQFSVKGKDFELTQDVFLSSMSENDVVAEVKETSPGKYHVKVLHDDVPVSVKILDEKGRVYHKYVHTSNTNFQQKIDLGKVDRSKELYISITGNKTNIYKAL